VESANKSRLITALEYFFDTDPGLGNGSAVAFNSAGDLTVQFNANINLLSIGKHQLFIRVKDNTGVWSYVNETDFQKVINIITAQIKTKSGWNMVSIPIGLDDMKVSTIFPESVSKLFQFSNGYVEASTFNQGIGYWLEFDQDINKNISSQSFQDKRIQLQPGWNLFGVLEKNITVSKITTNPKDVIQSFYYGYDNGYVIMDTLKTGNAYWVKATQAGYIDSTSVDGANIKLAKSVDLTEKGLVQISVTDKLNRKINLYLLKDAVDDKKYSLPPKPPRGVFDVRWETDSFIQQISKDGKGLLINSAEYPVTINVSGKEVRIKDNIGGKLINTLVKDGGKFILSNSAIESLNIFVLEIPTNYQLNQNYPNPFNPITKIEFGLPEYTKVNLEIYNILGQRVAKLVDNELEAGYHEIEWNAAIYTSGIYILQMQTAKYHAVKKMLLLK